MICNPCLGILSFARLGRLSTLTRMPLRSQTESDVTTQCYAMQRDDQERQPRSLESSDHFVRRETALFQPLYYTFQV